MRVIDPRKGSICCPHCESTDVRYGNEVEFWRCRRCKGRFVQEGVSREEIRLHEIERPRSGGSEANSVGQGPNVGR